MEVPKKSEWRIGLRRECGLPSLAEVREEADRRRLDEQLRDAAARQATQLTRSHATTLRRQGALQVPEGAEVVRQRDPGVKAVVKKATALYHVHPGSGMGDVSPLAKDARCVMHPADKKYAFVELLRATTEKEKNEGDTKVKIVARGYAMVANLEPMQKWVPVKGDVFTRVPSPDDIRQGALGDCYFLAALASIAAANPDAIQDMIRDNGDSVTVRLYATEYADDLESSQLKPKYITVDKSVLESSGKVGTRERAGGQRASGALWVQLLEKAYATLAARSPEELKPGDLHAKSRSLTGIEGGEASDALGALLGRPSATKRMPGHGASKGRLDDVLRVHNFQLNEANEKEIRAIKKARLLKEDNAEALMHPAFMDLVVRAVKAAGGAFSRDGDLQAALTDAGLFDRRGKVVPDCIPGGVDPRLTIRDVTAPIKRACFTKPPPEVNNLKASAAYQKLTTGREGKELRREELDELLKCPDFLALPDDVRDKFRHGLEAEFSGKRFTGVYSDSQLDVWDEVSRGLNNNALVCLGTPPTVGRAVDGEGHSGGEKKSKGLAGNHAYSVLGVYQPKVGEPGYVRPQPGGEPIRYLRVRNPWGEYGRVYGEGQNAEGQTGPRRAQAADEGEFLLELSDVTRRFEKFYVTNPLPSLFGPEQQRELRAEIGRLCGLARAFKADRERLYKDAAAVGERAGLGAAVENVAQVLGVDLEHEHDLRKLVDLLVEDVEGVNSDALYEMALGYLYQQGPDEAAVFVRQQVKEHGTPKPEKPQFGADEEKRLAYYMGVLRFGPGVEAREIYEAACKRGREEGLKAAKAYARQFAKEDWMPHKGGTGRKRGFVLGRQLANEGEGSSRDTEVVDPDQVRARLVKMKQQAKARMDRWALGLADEGDKESEDSDDVVAVRKAALSCLADLEERVNGLLARGGAGPTRRELADLCDEYRSRVAGDEAFKGSDDLLVHDALTPRATVLAAADVLLD